MNCDLIAPWYGLLERAAFGSLLSKCRGQYVEDLRDARHILVLGDGDGRALVQLLQACPEARVDYIDLSAQMLELARRHVAKLREQPRVTFLQGDALVVAWGNTPADSEPAGKYDAIVTHFFLDCLDQERMQRLAQKVRQSCAENALWVISEFQDSKLWTRGVVRALYLLFQISTGLNVKALPNYRDILRSNGFRVVAATSRGGGLLVSELWSSGPDRRRSVQSTQEAAKSTAWRSTA